MALVAGYIEVAVLLYRRLIDGQFIHRSRDFLWMTPAGYLLLFALPVLALWLLRRSTRLPFHTGVFLVAGAGAMSVLLLVGAGKVHLAALALLALGLAVQAARLVHRHPEGLVRLVRGSTPWLLGLLPVLWAGTSAYRVWTERRATAALPVAGAGAKNVLLIILDTVRAASMGLYGYSKETTPELNRWARRGVVFDRAIAASPWTLPSHSSIFTGRLPHELSSDWLTPLDGRWPTLAETLRDRGYRTGGFVANILYATWEHGLDRGFLHYEDYPFSLGMLLRHTAPGRRLTDVRRLRTLIGSNELIGRKSAAHIGDDFLHWLDRDRERPFLAFLNYYDAHDPYLPPQEYFREFAGHFRPNDLAPFRRLGLFHRHDQVTPEDIRLEMAGYDGAIAYLDTELSRLFDELERRSILDQTLVIVTSDHGEEFGEHGVFYHGHTLYRQALHVPLLMFGAGVEPAVRRVTQAVSLRDVPATVADLLAVPDPPFAGRSLRRFWGDSGAAGESALSEVTKGIRIPEWYPGAHGDLQSLVDGRYHYIRSAGGREELYDWYEDPDEAKNVSDLPESRPVLPMVRRGLDSIAPPGRAASAKAADIGDPN